MKKINMVDLNGQYRKIRWQVNREIKKVINSSSFINGPIVKEFQNNLQKYVDVKHVIPCANGTDALQIALMALELKSGDEIITTNFSFASTIEVILLLGLKPVVVDIDPRTFNINPSLIQDKILNVKLKYLDKYNKRRQEAANHYNAAFENIDQIEVPFIESDIDSHVYHQYTLKIINGKRDELADHLLKNNIPFGIYYPLGFHEQKAYKQEFVSDNDFPVTNKVKNHVISLPMHTELSKKQIKFISNTIISFFE